MKPYIYTFDTKILKQVIPLLNGDDVCALTTKYHFKVGDDEIKNTQELLLFCLNITLGLVNNDLTFHNFPSPITDSDITVEDKELLNKYLIQICNQITNDTCHLDNIINNLIK